MDIPSGHRRRHVSYQHRFRPSLGLYPFSGVVDGVRIDVRYGVQNIIRIAFLGKTDIKTGEPFQCPVGTHVIYHIGLEDILDPPVICIVLVLGEQQRVMDVLFHLLRPSPHRLIADEDVPFQQTRDDYLAVIGHYLSDRVTPVVLRHGAVPFRDLQIVVLVALLVHQVDGFLLQRLEGHVVQIVRDVLEDLVYQFTAVLGGILHSVSERGQPLDDVRNALYGIQSRGGTDHPRVRPMLPHHDGDLPFGDRFFPYAAPGLGETADMIYPFRNGCRFLGVVLSRV